MTMGAKVQEPISCENENEYRVLIDNLDAELERENKLPQIFHCSIYRVPKKIRKINEEAYTPRIVSIGPLHHGDKGLEAMEVLKLEYLKAFFKRTHACVKLEDIITKLREEENRIRSCYAVIIPQHSDEFVRMILYDACFIIEHFLRWAEHEFRSWNIIDPIISKPWWINDVTRDLILLENQIPFFVLEDIFKHVLDSRYSSFLQLSFDYFKMENGEFTKNKKRENHVFSPEKEMENDELPFAYFCKRLVKKTGPNGESKEEMKNEKLPFDYFRDHLLKKIGPNGESEDIIVQNFTDLRRIFYLPHPRLQSRRKNNQSMNHVYSASQLKEAGVKFKASLSRSVIDLQFEEGVLAIPPIVVSDETETFLRNIVALEQCRYPYDSYVTDYVRLLDFLVDDSKDVDILVDKKIMENGLGDNSKVAIMVNRLCLGLTITENCNNDYVKLCDELNAFYQVPRHKYKAIFIRDYWSTPWKIASFIAGIVLLLLTMVQTIVGLIPLFKAKGS